MACTGAATSNPELLPRVLNVQQFAAAREPEVCVSLCLLFLLPLQASPSLPLGRLLLLVLLLMLWAYKHMLSYKHMLYLTSVAPICCLLPCLSLLQLRGLWQSLDALGQLAPDQLLLRHLRRCVCGCVWV